MHAFLAPRQHPVLVMLGVHCGTGGAGWHVHGTPGSGCTSAMAGIPKNGGQEFISGSKAFRAALPHLLQSHEGQGTDPADTPLMWQEHSPLLGHTKLKLVTKLHSTITSFVRLHLHLVCGAPVCLAWQNAHVGARHAPAGGGQWAQTAGHGDRRQL